MIRQDGRWQEWAVAALFYQAVHLVNAFFRAKLHKAPENHKDRQKWVQMMLRPVAPDYDELYTAGRVARYDCIRYTDAGVNDLADAVRKIETHVNGQLNPPKSKS